jgi:hypothetical protein
MFVKPKPKKEIRYYRTLLYLRVGDGGYQVLGNIHTRLGGLTRAEKLKAVAAKGQWIEI